MLMRTRAITRPDDQAPGPPSRQWRRGVLASLGGALFGLVTSLYSAELRQILEASGRGFVTTGLPVAITAIVASVTGIVIYEYGFRRRYRGAVTMGEIQIGADALDGIRNDQDAVVGRSLRYLETRRFTEDLVVFLHGLGLDADDFRPYMSESRFHCVALTLYGFNADERDNDLYRPISLESHVQLLGYALRRIQRRYPRKRLTLVGFSFGADMILCLREFAPEVFDELRVRSIVLLDPNVNNTTTTISSRIAGLDSDRSLRELVAILRSAKTAREFRYLCEYLSKITSKNFRQVRRHAREMVERYRQRSFGPFLDAVGQLTAVTETVEIVLSLNHEDVFNEVARAARQRGLAGARLECSRTDHFDLMGPAFLADQLGRLR
ncbi:MAG TPA: alpha/beta fold hydrolase [Natronosporangium sp.]